jgi:bacterioferritin-associated ferredoxin
MNTKNELIVCRCESINLGQIQSTIRRSGAQTINQVKKLTRAGMGPCQGRTCAGALERVLEMETNIPVGTEPYRSRPPVRNISIESLAASADQYIEPAGPVSVVMLRTSDSDQPEQETHSEETE